MRLTGLFTYQCSGRYPTLLVPLGVVIGHRTVEHLRYRHSHEDYLCVLLVCTRVSGEINSGLVLKAIAKRF